MRNGHFTRKEYDLFGLFEEFGIRHGFSLNLHLGEDEPKLTEDLKIATFRIFQEAMTNVARHAQASRVTIRLHADGEELVVCVADNGVGYDEGVLESHESLGLIGMRERAEALGGRVEVGPAMDGGPLVTARIPMEIQFRFHLVPPSVARRRPARHPVALIPTLQSMMLRGLAAPLLKSCSMN